MTREVTEFDLRAEEFKHPDTKPEDLEFRADGKIVRKDRFYRGITAIVETVGLSLREYEIDDVVARVHERFGYADIIDAICRCEPVVFRRIPLAGESGDSWTLLDDAHRKEGVLPQSSHGLYEFAPLAEAEEFGYRIDYPA